MIPVGRHSSGATFAVRVQPRARRNAITGVAGNALKVALTAPPVDGKANRACLEFVANLLKVPRSSVSILSGETARNKVILVMGLPAEEVQKRLQMK